MNLSRMACSSCVHRAKPEPKAAESLAFSGRGGAKIFFSRQRGGPGFNVRLQGRAPARGKRVDRHPMQTRRHPEADRKASRSRPAAVLDPDRERHPESTLKGTRKLLASVRKANVRSSLVAEAVGQERLRQRA